MVIMSANHLDLYSPVQTVTNPKDLADAIAEQAEHIDQQVDHFSAELAALRREADRAVKYAAEGATTCVVQRINGELHVNYLKDLEA